MSIPRFRRWAVIGSVALAAAAAAALWVMTTSGGAAGNLPADKVTVSGSETEFTTQSSPQPATLFSFQMRTSTPEDLVLQLTAECSILTDLKTVGNQTAEAQGTVQIWATIDDRVVSVIPASPGQGTDNGKVVFCNRDYQRTTSNFTVDNQATIDDYIHTRSANAFNWAAINVANGPGGNVHTIKVFAELTKGTTGDATAEAIIGNRTLVIQPTSYAQTKPNGQAP